MKRIERINNVQSFNFFKNQLVLKKTDGNLYNNNIKFNFKGKPYAILENGHFCDIQKTKVEIYDIGFNLLTRIEKIGVIAGGRISNTDYFSIRWEDKHENEFFSIYKETEELKTYEDFIGKYLGIDYRVVFNDYDSTEIKLYHNIIEDKFLWTYTCPEGQKIEGEIYEYGGVLAFTERGKEIIKTLVGLDIKTGEILYKKEVNLIYYKQQNNMLYGFASNGFGDNIYIEIDIETGNVYKKQFPNYKNTVTGGLFSIKDKYLYYSIYKAEGIGIIDLKKREIIKEYSLDLPEGVEIDAPVVTDDKIYVLDSEQVLYIYERPKL